VGDESTQGRLSDVPEPNYLEGARLRFAERGTSLHLTVGEEVSWLNVRLTSLFPLSSPGRYVSVHDSGGAELGIIKSLAELNSDSLRIATLRLRSSYLLPLVRRIISVKERFGTLDWEVETDLGRRKFVTRNTRETTVRLSSDRVLLCDVDGNRYEVGEPRTLDAASRAYMARYL
jgi:hypothetical protein